MNGQKLKGMLGLGGNPLTDFKALTQLKSNVFLLLFCALSCTPALSSLWRRLDGRAHSGKPGGAAVAFLLRGLVPAALLLISTAMLVGNSYNPFLYFRF